ncbi:MAG: DUF4173 domain-containing protein [Sporolactobacillus sp.]
MKIATGALSCALLLLVIIPLLSSADDIFNALTTEAFAWLTTLELSSFVARTLFTIVVAGCLFSYLWSLFLRRDSRDLRRQWSLLIHGDIDWHQPASLPPPKPVKKTKAFTIDSVAAVTFLILFNTVYLLFVAIQFTYLFSANALPAGWSYAAYARHGLFELLAVTLINMSVLAALLRFASTCHRVLQGLEALLIGCTCIMLISAFIRLQRYEQAYGYTLLRVLTAAFMLTLFVMLVLSCWRIWQKGCHFCAAVSVWRLLPFSYSIIFRWTILLLRKILSATA